MSGLTLGLATMGSPLLWGAFLVGVLVMLAIDLGVFNRKTHTVSTSEALTWSLVWVALTIRNVSSVFVAYAHARPSCEKIRVFST